MFAVSVSIDNVIDSLAFYISLFVEGSEIIRAQSNRVAYPQGNFVLLTELFQQDIETPTLNYDADNLKISVNNPSKIAIQIDFYGDKAGDYARAFLSAYRSVYAYDKFEPRVKPLYCSDAMQAPLIDGEMQYKTRWTITAYLQYNPIVELPQNFPDELKINLFVNVDTTIE